MSTDADMAVDASNDTDHLLNTDDLLLVDDDVDLVSEDVTFEKRPTTSTIDLSSDEEEPICDEGEVNILTVRPKSKSRLIGPRDEPLEVLDVVEDRQNVNLEERTGYIKEYIEEEGLGILFSMDTGLVLFHLKQVWLQGERTDHVDCTKIKYELSPGTNVNFLDVYLEGEEYKCVSPEGFMRQASAVWLGERPHHLLKEIKTEKYQNDLKQGRRDFLDYAQNESFQNLALVRAKGKITGYLNNQFGLLETNDGDERDATMMCFFHVKDLYVYGTRANTRREPVSSVFPPGLNVMFDARKIEKFRGVSYQACAVFAGSWPAVPHPTMLPGGTGSYAPCYEVPNGQTFYYLRLSIKNLLAEQLRAFRAR